MKLSYRNLNAFIQYKNIRKNSEIIKKQFIKIA